MDGEDRRSRLAKLHEERVKWEPDRQGWAGRSVDRWSRFVADFGWEKLFFAGGIVLIAALAIGAFYIFTSSALGGGGKKQVSAGASHPTATRTRSAPTAPPTAIVIAVPTLPTAIPTTSRPTPLPPAAGVPPSNGGGGTNPTAPAPTQPPLPTQRPLPTQPPPPPPPQPSATPDTFTASDAIDLAVYWLEHNAPQHYQVDRGTCNALNTGNHWVVTCVANANGGSSTVSVCVFVDPLAVRPSDQC